MSELQWGRGRRGRGARPDAARRGINARCAENEWSAPFNGAATARSRNLAA